MHIMQLYDLENSFIFLVVIAIIGLLATRFVCMRWFKAFPASAASGSVIMAFAAYVGECLPQFQLPLWMQQLLMLEVLAIWIYGSFSLLSNFFFRETAGNPRDRFGLSAWIVATAMTVIMIANIAPLLHGIILLLVIFAAMLWLKYALMVCRALLLHIRSKFNEEVDAALLLGSAATACISWMLFAVFQEIIYPFIYQLFIVIGCFLYSFIFILMLRHWCLGRQRYLSTDWSANNSLVYGAPAVIGMTMLMTQVFSGWLIVFLWYWAVMWCLFITLLDVGHLVAKHSIRYDVRQWLRIFSYCMLYIFTWHVYFKHYSNHYLAATVAEHGLNIITVLFVFQLGYIAVAARLAAHEA